MNANNPQTMTCMNSFFLVISLSSNLHLIQKTDGATGTLQSISASARLRLCVFPVKPLTQQFVNYSPHITLRNSQNSVGFEMIGSLEDMKSMDHIHKYNNLATLIVYK